MLLQVLERHGSGRGYTGLSRGGFLVDDSGQTAVDLGAPGVGRKACAEEAHAAEEGAAPAVVVIVP